MRITFVSLCRLEMVETLWNSCNEWQDYHLVTERSERNILTIIPLFSFNPIFHHFSSVYHDVLVIKHHLLSTRGSCQSFTSPYTVSWSFHYCEACCHQKYSGTEKLINLKCLSKANLLFKLWGIQRSTLNENFSRLDSPRSKLFWAALGWAGLIKSEIGTHKEYFNKTNYMSTLFQNSVYGLWKWAVVFPK